MRPGTEPAPDAPTHRCPNCAHEATFGVTETTIDVSVIVFCPGCGTAMDRMDQLGAFEAEHRSDAPETFEEYIKRPEVLGVIRASRAEGEGRAPKGES